LSAVTTPVRASVQTGEPPNLAREGDPIGLTAEAGAGGLPTLRADPTRGVPPARLAGSARPNHGLTRSSSFCGKLAILDKIVSSDRPLPLPGLE